MSGILVHRVEVAGAGTTLGRGGAGARAGFAGVIRRVLGAATDLMRTWESRLATREHLAELPDYLLEDVGLSRAEVLHEASSRSGGHEDHTGRAGRDAGRLAPGASRAPALHSLIFPPLSPPTFQGPPGPFFFVGGGTQAPACGWSVDAGLAEKPGDLVFPADGHEVDAARHG